MLLYLGTLFHLLPWSFFLAGADGAVNEVFVSPDGSNAANIPGSESSPWQTLSHAIDQVRAIRPRNPSPENAATITLKGGIYFQPDMISLGRRDSYLTIQNFKEDQVSISGGFPLNLKWKKRIKGNFTVLSGRFTGSCAEAYYGDMRLLPARSPNIDTDWAFNMNIAQPGPPEHPFHKVKGLLKETDSCKRNVTGRFARRQRRL